MNHMKQLYCWLLRLYPRAWRDRYGEEFLALLESCPLSPRWSGMCAWGPWTRACIWTL